MFHVKICGISTIDDALVAARAGADAIGLNFVPESRRYIPHERARHIVEGLPPGIVKVGLFVNCPAQEVCRACDLLGLDLIQLHGDEPPEFIGKLAGRPVMRAFRLAGSDLTPVAEYLDACRRLECLPRLALLDAFCKDRYGGTGRTTDWSLAARYHEEVAIPPLVLAGGLNPSNVAEAIRAVRPVAVDTASGVESQPGCKDPQLVAGFVQEAWNAFGGAAYNPP